jgi:HAD superfamily hydrolase (TIGR01493 family)
VGFRLTSAVLFDLGDTLFRLLPIPDVTAEFAAALASEGFEDSEDEAARIIGNLSERLLGRHDLTEPAIAELAVPFIGSDARARKLAAMLDHMAGEADIARWEAAQGRDAVFEALRTRGLRVAYVSNTLTSPTQMRRRLAEFGLLEHAEVAVFSVEHRIRKPNPEIYRVALRSLGLEPEDCLFVGDRVREDIRGPRAVGMSAILTHEFRQEDSGDAEPLAVLSHLADLLPLLDSH